MNAEEKAALQPLHVSAFNAWVCLGELIEEKAIRTLEHRQEALAVYRELTMALEEYRTSVKP